MTFHISAFPCHYINVLSFTRRLFCTRRNFPLLRMRSWNTNKVATDKSVAMGWERSSIAFFFYGEIFYLINFNHPNLFSCKQISSFKPRVHEESAENGGSKQCRCIQWATITAWCEVNKCSLKGGTTTVTTRMFCSIFPNKWYCL